MLYLAPFNQFFEDPIWDLHESHLLFVLLRIIIASGRSYCGGVNRTEFTPQAADSIFTRVATRHVLMDPATVFGIAGTSIRVAMTACSLGEALFALIKDAKTVDQTLVTLAMQTRTIKELCISIANSVQRVKRGVVSCAYPTRASHGKHIIHVLRIIEEQLVDCEQTLDGLCKSIQGIRIGNTRPTERLWAQIKFNLNKEAMIEARAQLSLHLLTLNTNLQLLSL